MGKPVDRPAEVVERGDIFFFYRPKVELEQADGMQDVQRFHVVLRPEQGRPVRLLTVGKKRLPDVDGHERFWGYVQAVADREQEIGEQLGAEDYQTATRGERHQGAARAAGEGVYALLRSANRLHLAYELELPERPGEVQDTLNIRPQASFSISIKNPEAGSPPGAGRQEEEKADYPRELQKQFQGRRFAYGDLRLLDYEGAEFILIGAGDDPQRQYALDLPAEDETPRTADIFAQFRLERQGKRVEPLLKGRWR